MLLPIEQIGILTVVHWDTPGQASGSAIGLSVSGELAGRTREMPSSSMGALHCPHHSAHIRRLRQPLIIANVGATSQAERKDASRERTGKCQMSHPHRRVLGSARSFLLLLLTEHKMGQLIQISYSRSTAPWRKKWLST